MVISGTIPGLRSSVIWSYNLVSNSIQEAKGNGGSVLVEYSLSFY